MVNVRATLQQLLQQQGRHGPEMHPGQPKPAHTQHYSPLEIKKSHLLAHTHMIQRSSIYYCVFQQVKIHLVNNAATRAHLSAVPMAHRHDDALASITTCRRNKSAGILLSQD